MITADESSQNTGPTSRSSETCERFTGFLPTPHGFGGGKTEMVQAYINQKPKPQTAKTVSPQLTLFAEDFPASRFPLPGSDEARQMTVTSGLKCCGLLMNSDLLSSLVKMFLVSSQWHSTRCLMTWKPAVTKRGRLLFRLRVWVPGTEETDCGLWPTPTDASKGGGSSRSGDRIDETPTLQGMARKGLRMKGGPRNTVTSLQVMAKMFPTPTSLDYKGSGQTGTLRDRLDYAVERQATKSRLYPTPTQSDYRSPNLNPAKDGQPEPASGHALPAKVGGSLNPTWVEWLMGFPEGWTDLEHSGMQLSPNALNSSEG